MHRLKAILSPAPVAQVRHRVAALGIGVALAAVAGTASVALAGQREPGLAPRPTPVAVSRALPAPRVTSTAARATPAVAPKVTVSPRPNPAPRPAPVATPSPEVITNPSWTRVPMPSYPADALEQGSFGGQADLSCTVEADGSVSGCTILNERPEGLGYGAAAVAAAHNARLSPSSVEGASVGGTVRFTVRFNRAAE